jgi:peptidoglycan/LPS O-acetylase OafA/YrhL
VAAIAGLCVVQFTLIRYLGLDNAVWGQLFPVAPSVKLGVFFFSGALLYVARQRIAVRTVIACGLLVALLGTVHTPIGPVVFQVALPYLTIWAAHVNVRWMSRFGRHGDFSYGIYLFAFPVQQLLVSVLGLMSLPFFMTLAFAVTLSLAVVSWHCVEKPALAWKTRPFPLWRRPLPGGVTEMGWDMSGAGPIKERVASAEIRAS